MRSRIFIPFMILVLSWMSAVAHAGGSDRHGTHVHIHQHGGSPHQHTHAHTDTNKSVPNKNHSDAACKDTPSSDHDHCCSEQDHHPEPVAEGLTSRNRDLPIYTASIVTTIPDFYKRLTRQAHLSWTPLRQRPPDYLGSLRTYIMLN